MDMISTLTLTNFRNHETFRINTDSKNIALVGANGTGKTNVLEGISLLNGGTGIRHAQSSEIARFGTNNYAVCANLFDGNEISVFWNGSGHRAAQINGERMPLSELAKQIAIIWLTPREDLLFLDSPSTRRTFFDNLVAGFDAKHIGYVSRLGKLLSERAYALKNTCDDDWLEQIEKNIASMATSVADARVRFISELNHFFDAGKVGLSGIAEKMLIDDEKTSSFEVFYKNHLSQNRFLVSDKMAIDGPHRTDFMVTNSGLNLPAAQTSSGQQKALLYRLIIANVNLIRARNPDKAIIVLLDEADGHLDKTSRETLLNELSGTNAQIWVTGSDRSAFDLLSANVCQL